MNLIGAVASGGGDATQTMVLATGGTAARAVGLRNSEYKNAKDYGVTGNGTTDDTAAIAALFTAGGRVYFPPGNYLIASAGPIAGGVWWTITQSLWVECDPNCVFFTNTPGLDHDMFRGFVPTNGVGLPAQKIDIEIHGGVWDLTNQKNSTNYPFQSAYPGVNPGTSATCDGISIYGSYVSGGVTFGALGNVIIEPDLMFSGTHWTLAGGDSHVTAGIGAEYTRVKSRFVASRDTAVYITRDDNCFVGDNCEVEGIFDSCSFGVSFKRGFTGNSIGRCRFYNCMTGAEVLTVTGTSAQVISGMFDGAIFDTCMTAIRLDNCVGVEVSGCTIINTGAVDSTGAAYTTTATGTPTPILLNGATASHIHHNTIVGVNSLYNKDGNGTLGAIQTILYSDFSNDVIISPVPCQYNRFEDNHLDGFHGAGSETGTSNWNIWGPNTALNMTLPNGEAVLVGAESIEIRRDLTTFREVWMKGLLVAAGTTAAPSFGLNTTPGTGFNVDSSGSYMTFNGALRISALSASITFGAVLSAPVGSAGAPAYAFTADLTSGMYRVGSGKLGFAAGGVEVIELDAVASAVNFLAIAPAVTTGNPSITSTGTDTNVSLLLATKGTGLVLEEFSSGTAAPTTSVIPAGAGAWYKNTTTGNFGYYVNDAGTVKLAAGTL